MKDDLGIMKMTELKKRDKWIIYDSVNLAQKIFDENYDAIKETGLKLGCLLVDR
jgi:hypothetical protein